MKRNQEVNAKNLISQIDVFRARRRILTHAIPYVFINLLIVTAWLDPQPGRLNSGLGVINVTLVWTPIFLIHLARYYFLESEYQSLKSFQQNWNGMRSDDVPYKRKREDFPVSDLKRKNCDKTHSLQREEFILCLSNNRLTTPHAGTIKLTKTECLLMQLLMKHSEHPIPVDYIQRSIWGYETQDMSALKNTVYRLRKKLEITPQEPTHIVFVPDEGYAFFPDC